MRRGLARLRPVSPGTIRSADPRRDAAACAAIYAPSVEASVTSFEERAPGAAEMAARIERVSATHPWLVVESGEEVVGYAYACEHRERRAYRWAADVSVYVAAGRRGQGFGRALYEALFERLRRQRFQVACAGITLPNQASIGLHESLGFAAVGISPRVGWKHGAWRDVGWWQLELVPSGTEPPAEPLPPDPPPPPGYH
jgi:L-amino acid N-acyltransferase YncA